jgi:AbrB family looped-hinge helix DNA binding protein
LTNEDITDMNYIFRKTEEINMKISERGQITIPKTLRDRFGFTKDVEVDLVATRDGVLIQKRSRSKHPVDQVYGILDRPSDTDSYIEEVRGR